MPASSTKRSQKPSRRNIANGRLLRGDGRCQQVRGDAIAGILITSVNIVGAGARDSLLSHARNRGPGSLQQADDRRWTGECDPCHLYLVGGGLSRYPAVKKHRPGKNAQHSALCIKPAGPHRCRRCDGINGDARIGPRGCRLYSSPSWHLAALEERTSSATKKRKNRRKRPIRRLEEQTAQKRPPEKIEDALKLDALELEVGYALIPLADRRKGGDLEDRIVLIRKQLATDMGLILPGVRLRDNPNIEPNDYLIKLKGIEIDRGTIYPGHFMAIDTGLSGEKITGIKTKDPLFGQDAYWIDSVTRERAEMLGYTVVELRMC